MASAKAARSKPRPCPWRGRCCGARPSTRNAIRRKPRRMFSRKSGGRVKPAQVTALMRQLATVTHAGIPLVQAFDLVADAADGDGVRSLVKRIREDVAAGFSLATALRRHPSHFDALLCNLVDAGEQSGALDEMLSRIATHGEKNPRHSRQGASRPHLSGGSDRDRVGGHGAVARQGGAAVRGHVRELRRRAAGGDTKP